MYANNKHLQLNALKQKPQSRCFNGATQKSVLATEWQNGLL